MPGARRGSENTHQHSHVLVLGVCLLAGGTRGDHFLLGWEEGMFSGIALQKPSEAGIITI